MPHVGLEVFIGRVTGDRQKANGIVNSPATVFDHEADHALEHKTNTQEYEVK